MVLATDYRLEQMPCGSAVCFPLTQEAAAAEYADCEFHRCSYPREFGCPYCAQYVFGAPAEAYEALERDMTALYADLDDRLEAAVNRLMGPPRSNLATMTQVQYLRNFSFVSPATGMRRRSYWRRLWDALRGREG